MIKGFILKALIIGENGGIGSAISQKLKENNYEILTIKSRLQEFVNLEKEINEISKKHNISALILCAGFGKFDPLEAMKTDEIINLINVNLSANLIITSKLLKNLKQNKAHIIAISSIEALRFSKFSSIYSASKAGLRAFLLSLFEEARRDIKVTCINADITKTPFYENLRFEPDDDINSFIDTDEIANFALEILRTKSVVTDITIRPKIIKIKKKS